MREFPPVYRGGKEGAQAFRRRVGEPLQEDKMWGLELAAGMGITSGSWRDGAGCWAEHLRGGGRPRPARNQLQLIQRPSLNRGESCVPLPVLGGGVQRGRSHATHHTFRAATPPPLTPSEVSFLKEIGETPHWDTPQRFSLPRADTLYPVSDPTLREGRGVGCSRPGLGGARVRQTQHWGARCSRPHPRGLRYSGYMY